MKTKLCKILNVNELNNLEIFLIFSPFIDLLTSLGVRFMDFSLTFGMLFRFLIIVCLFILFCKNSKTEKKKIIMYFMAIIIYFALFITLMYETKGKQMLFAEFKTFLKTFFLPIGAVISFNFVKNNGNKSNSNIFNFSSFLYIILLFIPIVLGASFLTYEKAGASKLGYIGWFYSPNEISAIIAILSPFLIVGLLKNYKNIFSYVMFFAYIFIVFQIGTKASFAGIFATLLGFVFSSIILIFNTKKNKKESMVKATILIFIFIASFIIYQKSPSYKNLQIQNKWYEKHNNTQNNDLHGSSNESNSSITSSIDNSSDEKNSQDVNTDKKNAKKKSINNVLNKILGDNYKKIINIIFSSRNQFLIEMHTNFYETNLSKKIFGMGYINSDASSLRLYNISEIDYFDIIFMYGIVGGILYFIPLTLIFVKIIFSFFKKFKKNIADYDSLCYLFSIILIAFLALFSGHVFVSPAVSAYIIFILPYAYWKFSTNPDSKIGDYEYILGIKVNSFDYKELRDRVNKDIKENNKCKIIAINPEKVLKSRKDDALKKMINQADYCIPDGMGIVIASKLNKGNIKKRVTGIDCMDMLCNLAAQKQYRVFMYGAKKEVIEKGKVELEKKYKSINIVGCIDGYEKDNNKIIKTINKVKPHIIFVALGSPKQEKWIDDNIDKLNVNVFQGVGGSFDVYSGNIKRAPIFMQRMGLEWLYRLYKEPKRIFRQFKILSFIMLLLIGKKE